MATPPFTDAPFVDQRSTGFARVVNGDGDVDAIATVDSGAVEFSTAAPTFTSDPEDPMVAATGAVEDVAYSYSVTTTDTDLGELFTLSALEKPDWLTFVDNGDGTGTLSGTPINEDIGAPFDEADHAVSLQVEDWAHATAVQDFVITVVGVNDAPDLLDDVAETLEDAEVIISVLANDFDVDGELDPASVTVITPLADLVGTTSVDPENGRITYTPPLDFNGSVSFEYEVTDLGTPATGMTSTASVTVTIDAMNDPPVAEDDAALVDEDNVVVINVLANDSDVDGALVPELVIVPEAPTNGSTAIDLDTGAITYTPNANFNGVDSFVYRIFDDGSPLPSLSGEGTVTVTVAPINDAPVTQDVSSVTDEDTPITINPLVNDSDADGDLDITSVTITSEPANGTALVDAATGLITYTPNPDFFGEDVFDYEVSDLGTPLPPLTGSSTITVSVNAINDPPVIAGDTATATEDNEVFIPVLDNDSDVDGNLDLGTLQIVTEPANGSAVIDLDAGGIIYTPDPDFFGFDLFEYEVSDDGSPVPTISGVASVAIVIEGVNDPPRTNDDEASTLEDTPVTISVLDNDTDVDGELLPSSVQVISEGLSGKVVVNATTGAITYTPAPNSFETEVFTYSVQDSGAPGAGEIAFGTVTVTVSAVNDTLTAGDDTDTTDEDVPVIIDVVANDNDPDGNVNVSTISVLSGPSNGSATVNSITGAITYTPNANFNRSDSFEYQVSDNGDPLPVNTVTADVQITVITVNDAPVLTAPLAVGGLQDTALPIEGIGVSDLDLDELGLGELQVTLSVENGAVSVDLAKVASLTAGGIGTPTMTLQGSKADLNAALSTLTYTGDPSFYGIDAVSISVSDLGNVGSGGPQSDSASITVALVPTRLVVSTLNDENNGNIQPGDVTLREAIAEIADGGTIEFAPSLSGTISMKTGLGQFVVDRNMTIVGPGSDLISVSGGLASRVFLIDDGDLSANTLVEIRDLAIADGNAGSADGGAIFNAEILTLNRVEIFGSRALNGGGIHNEGILKISDSSGSGNNAEDSGGFISNLPQGSVTLNGATMAENTARQGGAISTIGALTVTNSTVSGNRATDSGGGISQGAAESAILTHVTRDRQYRRQ